MKIALIQNHSVPFDIEANAAYIQYLVNQAADQGAEFAIFGMQALFGPFGEALEAYESFYIRRLDALHDIAETVKIPTLVPYFYGVDTYSVAQLALCFDGKIDQKTLELKSSFPPKEEDEDVFPILKVNGHKFGVTCDYANTSSEGQANFDTLLYLPIRQFRLSDSFTQLGGSDVDERSLEHLKFLATQLDVHVLGVQGVGGYDEQLFAGRSIALNAKGEVLALADAFSEETVFVDLDETHLENTAIEKRYTPHELLWKALTTGLSDYIHDNGFERVVIGLSGGIDSALVCALAVDALGSKNVKAIIMPGPFTSKESVVDSYELARNLQIETEEISITGIYKETMHVLQDTWGTVDDITSQNLQARIRGNILMAKSNETGAMVLNTTNKSETAVGYSTLYGDAIGSYAPLIDVTKTAVYALANTYNSIIDGPGIPKQIIEKEPTAELTAHQTDEDSLGVSYKLIDWVIEEFVEKNRSLFRLTQLPEHVALEDLEEVISMILRSEFKRRQEPFGPTVSMGAFSEILYPITNSYREKSELKPEESWALSDSFYKDFKGDSKNIGFAMVNLFEQLFDSEYEIEDLDDSQQEKLESLLADLESLDPRKLLFINEESHAENSKELDDFLDNREEKRSNRNFDKKDSHGFDWSMFFRN